MRLPTSTCAIPMALPSVGATRRSRHRCRPSVPTIPTFREQRYMAKRSDRNLLVGLDIGTSKVVAIVGEIKTDGALEIIGIGSHPSPGLKKRVRVDLESTLQSIQRAVEEAELMAGCEIPSVYAGIAGPHVRSLNSHALVPTNDKEA